MLEKYAKISNVVQAIAAAVCLYFYFYFSHPRAAMGRSMNHPSWLPLFLILLFAVSVLTSSVLTLLFLSNKGVDLRGKILRGYLDLRTFRAEPPGSAPRWANLHRGCSVKVYAELTNRNDVAARFYPEKTSLALRVGRQRFYGTWEYVMPGQHAMYERNKETLHDLFDGLHPSGSLQRGVPWTGYVGFIVDSFNRALLHDKTALTANVKVQIHDTFGGVHTIKGNDMKLAIEQVCLPSEFAA